MATFPAPAASNAACGCPARRLPAPCLPRGMGPLTLGALATVAAGDEGPGRACRVLACRPAPVSATSASRSPDRAGHASEGAAPAVPPVTPRANTTTRVSEATRGCPATPEGVDPRDHPGHWRGWSALAEALQLPSPRGALRASRRVVRPPWAWEGGPCLRRAWCNRREPPVVLGGGVDHAPQSRSPAARLQGRVLATARHLLGPCAPPRPRGARARAAPRRAPLAVGQALGARALQAPRHDGPHGGSTA